MSPFETEVRIGVGQVIRADLAVPAAHELQGAGSRPFHVFGFDGRKGQKRNLVLHTADPEVSFEVLAPEGRHVELLTEREVHGNRCELARKRFEIVRPMGAGKVSLRDFIEN